MPLPDSLWLHVRWRDPLACHDDETLVRQSADAPTTFDCSSVEYPVANPSADRTPNPFDTDSWLDAPGEYAAFELEESIFDDVEHDLFGSDGLESSDSSVGRDGPSVPIILLSAACGIAAAIIGAYLARFILDLNAPFSAAVGTLSMLAVLAGVAIVLSRLVESRAVAANVGMSCGLVLFTILFFGICTIVGAFTATFILTLGR